MCRVQLCSLGYVLKSMLDTEPANDRFEGADRLEGATGVAHGRSVGAARGILSGERRRPSAYLAFAGPAVVVSIAYIDPGNFATNIQAGAKYGYGLLWVVLLANLIAMLFQALSAKLGIVTGRNLAEMCRDEFPRPVVWAMWIVSEVAAMATDLAEFLGGAIGLSLLFSMPLLAGMVVTGVVTYGILMFERHGFRSLELIIGSMVGIIALCYLIEMFIVPVDWGSAAFHTVRAAASRCRGSPACRRYHRRDCHAPRRLSAFRPDPGPHAGPQRQPSGAWCCTSQIVRSSSR